METHEKSNSYREKAAVEPPSFLASYFCYYVATMEYTRKTLKNGVRVIMVPDRDAFAATVLVLVATGSKYETKKLNGLSHFLEHMCFKGTTARPRAIDIAAELDSLGAQYNAFTSQEYTGYYAKVDARHFEKALNIVADLYLHPTFPEVEIEKEKGVIIEEIHMYEDLPQNKVWEVLYELMYGDQPAGWSIAGRPENIREMSRKDFIAYRGKHYVADGTVVIVSGAFNFEKAMKQIEAQFIVIPTGKKYGKKKTNDRQDAPAVALAKKKSDQTHLAVGVRSFAIEDARVPALAVLATVLGGGMSSRLWQRVREELGAAYYVRAHTEHFTDHGALEIGAGVRHDSLRQVIGVIMEELARLRDGAVPPEELARAKDSIIGRMYLGLEKSDEVASFYGSQEILGQKIEKPDDRADKIRKVSAEDVHAVARDIIRESSLNLALIGPFSNKKALEKLLRPRFNLGST